MSDSKKDIILEYKDQIRILREEVAELQEQVRLRMLPIKGVYRN
jgi:hypothetical protein